MVARVQQKDGINLNSMFFGGIIVDVEHLAIFVWQDSLRVLCVAVGMAKLCERVAFSRIELRKEQEDFVTETHLFMDAVKPRSGIGHGIDDFQFGAHAGEDLSLTTH